MRACGKIPDARTAQASQFCKPKLEYVASQQLSNNVDTDEPAAHCLRLDPLVTDIAGLSMRRAAENTWPIVAMVVHGAPCVACNG